MHRFIKKRIYLDYAAGQANPSSPHAEGKQARERLENARKTIAQLVEAKPDDVIFTSGATEANALAILGVTRALKNGHAVLGAFPRAPGLSWRFFYLPGSHSSIVENVRAAAAETGARAEPLPIKDAQVDCTALSKALNGDAAFITMEAVCGETGVIWNTREVRATLTKAAAQGNESLLHVDASQAPLVEKLARAHFGADLLTLDGAKVGASYRIGCLVAPRTVPLEPLYRGGGQERGMRPGTEDVSGAEDFARALVRTVGEREAFRAKAKKLRQWLVKELERTLPAARSNEGAHQAPHILNLSFPGLDTDYLVALLDAAGFAVSTKSACETDSAEGSRAVFALYGDQERAASTLRISWGRGTRLRDLQRFARALRTAVAFIDTSALR